MKIDGNLLLEKSKMDLENEIKILSSKSFPSAQEIHSFDVTDEIFKMKPKIIEKQKVLPPKGNQVIYVFRFVEQFRFSADLQTLKEEILKVKTSNNDGHKQVTGIIEQNWEYQLGRLNDVTLYIGSSSACASRFREHVSWGSKGTSTLLLRNWPSMLDKRFRLTFNYFNFGTDFGSTALKFIEYHFSKELRPLIGHNRRT